MKTNVRIVVIVLAAAMIFGVGSCAIDSLGDDKTYISPTPTGGMKPTIEATETPTPTKEPTKAPTEAPTPTAEPTTEVTPEATPEATPEPTPDVPKNLTEAEAVEYLKSISADRLALPMDIGECKLEVDSWTSMIMATDCYCVNVLHPDGYLLGMYYVAVDGSVVYRMNEDEELEVISE